MDSVIKHVFWIVPDTEAVENLLSNMDDKEVVYELIGNKLIVLCTFKDAKKINKYLKRV